MNYLSLCQTVGQLAGIPGCVPGVYPTTTIGVTGEFARICSWVNIAWSEIQRHREDWNWLRNPVQFNTVAETQRYSPATVGATNYSIWKMDSFRIYLQAAGIETQVPLEDSDYEAFYNYFLLGARTVTYAFPTVICMDPQDNLCLGLRPNDVYVVNGEYFQNPQVFALDADIPLCAARFHQSIVYRAMMKYGAYEAAGEVIAEYQTLYNEIINKMEFAQTPNIEMGGSLI